MSETVKDEGGEHVQVLREKAKYLASFCHNLTARIIVFHPLSLVWISTSHWKMS